MLSIMYLKSCSSEPEKLLFLLEGTARLPLSKTSVTLLDICQVVVIIGLFYLLQHALLKKKSLHSLLKEIGVC